MEEMEELTYLFDFKTPPKIVTDASGKKVEVILSYEDYLHLIEILEDAYDAALIKLRENEEYTSWEDFKAEMDKK